MLTAYRDRLEARSAAILRTLDTRLDRIVIGWLILAAAASALRIVPRSMVAPVSVGEVLPYFFLVLAPFASTLLALRWFRRRPPAAAATRLARFGRWRSVGRARPGGIRFTAQAG